MIGFKKYYSWIFVLLSSILYIHIGYFLPRNNFQILLIDFGLLFLLYFFALKATHFNWWLVIIPKIALIASIPALSDDFYRFIWDGNLITRNINPYQFLPTELPPNAEFYLLNSKHYYSVYPPLLQLIFGISAYFSNHSLITNILILRIIILLFEIGTIWLILKILKENNYDKNRVLIYALNPLVVLELVGNLHFEGVMLFFILMAFWQLYKSNKFANNWFLSALYLALGVLIKLLPLMFLPLIIKKLGIINGLKYCSVVLFLLIIAFIPFSSNLSLPHIFSSIDLYYQKFEFNASIYYLIKWLGIFLAGNNPIQIAGPILAFFAGIAIFIKSYKAKKSDFNKLITNALIILSIYFIFATTVHPWYICTLVGLAVFSNIRFPIAWSAMVFLSYSAYQVAPFTENLWLLAFEYLVVFGFIFWERKQIFFGQHQ
jgi:alpha-1,6-mannosyltransferase